MDNKVSILGTEYTILIRKYDEDERFRDLSIDGYCDGLLKQLVICDMRTWPEWEKESEEYDDASMRQTLRHEIVHAFFDESGLADSSFKVEGAVARPSPSELGGQFLPLGQKRPVRNRRFWPGRREANNEEMVDWIAVQGPKIHAARQAVGAL